MKIKAMTASILASLLMVGSAYAMDSAAIEEHMKEISERSKATATEESEVAALEQEVQELKELIHMMLEEEGGNY